MYGRLQAHNQTANALTRDTPTRAEMELVRLHADGGVGQFGHRLTRPSTFFEWADLGHLLRQIPSLARNCRNDERRTDRLFWSTLAGNLDAC